jgi:hypothetical protein
VCNGVACSGDGGGICLDAGVAGIAVSNHGGRNVVMAGRHILRAAYRAVPTVSKIDGSIPYKRQG